MFLTFNPLQPALEQLQFLCELGKGPLGVAEHGGLGRHSLVGGEELPLLHRLVEQKASSMTATNARVTMSTTICEPITGLETPGRLGVL